MNVAETLRSFIRRWYITVPGVILAIAVALGAWFVIPPAYQRSASVLLLPGASSLPEADANPYLYLGGLTSAAEVLVRAVGSENTMRAIDEEYPGTQIEVLRDGSTGGPVVRIAATGSTDAIAAAVTDDLLVRTGEVLDQLQSEQGIPPGDRITLSTITIDDASTIQQRPRIGTSAALGVGTLLVVLVAAAIVDGLSRRRRAGDPDDESPETPDAAPSGNPEAPAADEHGDLSWLANLSRPTAESSGTLRRDDRAPRAEASTGPVDDADADRENDGVEQGRDDERPAKVPAPRRTTKHAPQAAVTHVAESAPDIDATTLVETAAGGEDDLDLDARGSRDDTVDGGAAGDAVASRPGWRPRASRVVPARPRARSGRG